MRERRETRREQDSQPLAARAFVSLSPRTLAERTAGASTTDRFTCHLSRRAAAGSFERSSSALDGITRQKTPHTFLSKQKQQKINLKKPPKNYKNCFFSYFSHYQCILQFKLLNCSSEILFFFRVSLYVLSFERERVRARPASTTPKTGDTDGSRRRPSVFYDAVERRIAR